MITIQRNIPLAPFTTFGIGGSADYFIQTFSRNTFHEALRFAYEQKLPYFILGKGANILVGDKGYRGIVIKNETKEYSIQGNTITVDSGAEISEIIRITQALGYSGFEHFAGIPSSVGGALWQNLHFLSPDRSRTIYISEILTKAIIYKNGEETEVPASFFRFGYDYSVLHDTQDIVLSASFRLRDKASKEIESVITENLKWRMVKHPENAINTSAGSIFKKIADYGAGRLIEAVGLKEYTVGNAQISAKHANFIINKGGATAKDVRTIIDVVQKRVFEKRGLQMIPEIRFVGEF